MPASKAQQKAVSKYMKENYDVYQIRMKKGQKDTIKAHADSQGESINAFIGRAIAETMDRDSAPQKAAGAPAEGGGGIILTPGDYQSRSGGRRGCGGGRARIRCPRHRKPGHPGQEKEEVSTNDGQRTEGHPESYAL